MPLLESTASLPLSNDPAPCTFGLHFSADRRTHQLTCLATGRETAQTGCGAGWSVELSADDNEVQFGSAANAGGIACRWMLLQPGQGAPTGCEPMLRRPGERLRVGRLLSDYPMRPLLVTFARTGELPPALVDAVHRAVLSAVRRRNQAALAPAASRPTALPAPACPAPSFTK